MIKVELNNKTYNIPNSWYDMKIGQLQSISNVDPLLDEIDKTVHIVSILSGMNTDDLYALPYTEYKTLLDIISFIQTDIVNNDNLLETFEYEGVSYEFQCSFENMTTAEYIDLDTLSKSNDVNNLHTLLAIMYRPKGEKYDSRNIKKRSKIFQDNMPLTNAIGAQVFMLVLGQMCSSNMEDSLMNQPQQ